MDDGRTVRSCRLIHAHCMSNISKQLSCYCKDAENRVVTGRERRATWRRARRMRPLLARAGLERKTKRANLDRANNWNNGRERRPGDGRRVDALAMAAEEGRGHAAKCPGEALAA